MGGFQFEFAWDEKTMEALDHKLRDQRTKMGRMFGMAAKPVESFTVWYGAETARELNRAAPKGVTGKLAKSHEFRWTRTAGGEVISTAPHAMFNDQGTKPHWAPIGPLRKWAALRKINPYALQQSIAKKGTKASHYQSEGLRRASRHLSPGLKKLGGEIAVLWGTD